MTLRLDDASDLARPDLPKPACRVMLICGPPASGKSTYVKMRASDSDILIDFDSIAREHGYGRYRPSDAIPPLLQIRNKRLASLAKEPRGRVAWVILSAPSQTLRQWWCDALGVEPDNLIVLIPSRDELRRRIMSDPDRLQVRTLHLTLVDKWFTKERDDDSGLGKRGNDADGYPTDPLHPLNRAKRRWRIA